MPCGILRNHGRLTRGLGQLKTNTLLIGSRMTYVTAGGTQRFLGVSSRSRWHWQKVAFSVAFPGTALFIPLSGHGPYSCSKRQFHSSSCQQSHVQQCAVAALCPRATKYSPYDFRVASSDLHSSCGEGARNDPSGWCVIIPSYQYGAADEGVLAQ
jgi:hypothetical protein